MEPDPFEVMKTQLLARLYREGVDPARLILDDVAEDDNGVFYDYVPGSDDQGFPDISLGVERRYSQNYIRSDDTT